jgi:hypothetical protein
MRVNRRNLLGGGAAAIAVILIPGATRLQAGSDPVVQAPARSVGLLPMSVIIPADAVSQFFPEVTTVASSGPDATALGNPVATRAIVYTSADGTRKVTVSVDLYPTTGDASSAYQQAVAGSELAPGFNLLPAPDLGQQAHAGTSFDGLETHVGLGAVDRDLIVAATIAGFDAGAENIAKLTALARKELDLASANLDSGG